MSTKKIISYNNLGLYDENIKNVIITQASTALALARKYTDGKIEEIPSVDTSDIYTKTEVDAALSDKSDINHNHDNEYDVLGSANKALEDANAYTDLKISDLATTTVMDDKIDTHNTSTSAHNDIRTLINELQTEVESAVNKCNGSINEVVSATEPDDQNIGDYWLVEY